MNEGHDLLWRQIIWFLSNCQICQNLISRPQVESGGSKNLKFKDSISRLSENYIGNLSDE